MCIDKTNVIAVLARIYVDNIESAIPLYQELSGAVTPNWFTFRGIRLVEVGVFLLIEGGDESIRNRSATIIVRDIAEATATIKSAGGELLDGPGIGPNGPRLVARHQDGNTVEYIQHSGYGQ